MIFFLITYRIIWSEPVQRYLVPYIAQRAIIKSSKSKCVDTLILINLKWQIWSLRTVCSDSIIFARQNLCCFIVREQILPLSIFAALGHRLVCLGHAVHLYFTLLPQFLITQVHVSCFEFLSVYSFSCLTMLHLQKCSKGYSICATESSTLPHTMYC